MSYTVSEIFIKGVFIYSAVYSPVDTNWERAIDLAWHQMAHSDLEVEFFYYRDDYDVTLEESRTGK